MKDKVFLTAQELTIGNRYYLDKLQDISGVFVSMDVLRGCVGFNNLLNNYCYQEDKDGIVWFSNNSDNYSLTES